jgi:hypothetical protein
MSGREILLHAVRERWIGQNLRRSDELREVSVAGARATGRLYKFGRQDRPDRGRQYFLRENGEWRVDLRGERERLRIDFESFVVRSGLEPSEAAFFILETRLLEKVTAADFIPPVSVGTPDGDSAAASDSPVSPAHLRVVAVRESPDDPDLVAITIADRVASLRYVLRVGDRLGSEGDGYRLVRFDGKRAWLEGRGGSLVLTFDPAGPPLNERLRVEPSRNQPVSLLAQARLGEHREGLMSQWRNVGLRDRPQLLQQARLVPEFSADREMILGLRVRDLVAGSFWHQLGLAESDLLERVNGKDIDSLARWQRMLRIVETDSEISILVRRDDRRLAFHTRTVPPRPGEGR